MHYAGDRRRGCGVDRFASATAMGQGGGSALPVSCQDAPGVARAHSHQHSCLMRRDVLRQQAVQNLDSRLFFWRQCHIQSMENVTFLLAS